MTGVPSSVESNRDRNAGYKRISQISCKVLTEASLLQSSSSSRSRVLRRRLSSVGLASAAIALSSVVEVECLGL